MFLSFSVPLQLNPCGYKKIADVHMKINRNGQARTSSIVDHIQVQEYAKMLAVFPSIL